MASVITWFKNHDRAILITAVAVAKSGVVGTTILKIASAIAAIWGITA